MSSRRDDDFTEYVAARMTSLRRVAYLLCQDWQRADDLVQGAITKLYVHWGRARAVEHTDAYARGNPGPGIPGRRALRLGPAGQPERRRARAADLG